MDFMKFIDQVESLVSKHEAIKLQAQQIVANFEALSIADRQKLYSILNILGRAEEFDRFIFELKQLSNS